MKFKRRELRLLDWAHGVVRSAFDTLETKIQGVEKVGEEHLAKTSGMIVDLGRRQDVDLARHYQEIKKLQQDFVEIQRDHQTFIRGATDRFNTLTRNAESKIDELQKCIDLVKGKRDLNYMTVDEYLLQIEPGRRGPISDAARQRHETELSALMKARGLEPGRIRAPFDKIHLTYPRDLIVAHFTDGYPQHCVTKVQPEDDPGA